MNIPKNHSKKQHTKKIFIIDIKFIGFTSAPIGIWKWNVPPFQEITTDRPTDDGQTGS